MQENGVGGSDPREGASAPAGAVACVECGSQQVRPSGHSYPMDKVRNPEGSASFWRCSHCGARFMGPQAQEQGRKHRARSPRAGNLDREIVFMRTVKRWIFPVLVILCTILAVIYMLERRDPPPEQIISPGD